LEQTCCVPRAPFVSAHLCVAIDTASLEEGLLRLQIIVLLRCVVVSMSTLVLQVARHTCSIQPCTPAFIQLVFTHLHIHHACICMYTSMSAACICTYTYAHTCCRHTFTYRLIVLVESLPDIQAPAYSHILRLFAHGAVRWNAWNAVTWNAWNAWRAQRAECKCACRDVSSEHATQEKKRKKRGCLCCLFTNTFTRTHKDTKEIQSHPKYSHTDTLSHKSLTRHSRRPPPPPSPQIHTYTSRTFAEERVRRKT